MKGARRFNFFDREEVIDKGETDIFQKPDEVTCTASGRGQLIIGDINGNLHMINHSFQVLSIKAYGARVTHMCHMKQQNVLVTIGDDSQAEVNPMVKVYNFDKLDETGSPLKSRVSKALAANMKPTEVTALSVHEGLGKMAVGFADGTVLLFHGDVIRVRNVRVKAVISHGPPVTGLGFQTQPRAIFLFVSTEQSVVSVNVTTKDKEQADVLEKLGCPVQCSTMSDPLQDNQFVVGRKDALYFYQSDGRGPCIAFEGTKLQLYWFKGYLVVVSKEEGAMMKTTHDGRKLEMNIVTVYDVMNKFIAYSAPFLQIVALLFEWGSLFVLTADHKLHKLQEKDTQNKLDILFKKNAYQLAISLVKNQQYDEDGLIDIFRQYGDHLYNKGDFEGAMTQYIKTIGKLEASYVIRKYLDTQKINSLTAYLQTLHKQQLATKDHTTLLLNCYTKLRDVKQLDNFVQASQEDVRFDIQTAVEVLKRAGYYEQALYLAEKYKQHEWYLQLLLEDVKDFKQALIYIGNLDFIDAEEIAKKYGKELIEAVPDEMTSFLCRLCTGYVPDVIPGSSVPTKQEGFKDVKKAFSYIGNLNFISNTEATTERKAALLIRSNPEDFIHIFVNNSKKLIEFLEYLVNAKVKCGAQVYDTLIELYLRHMKDDPDATQGKLLGLLQNQEIKYDVDQALALCQMHNFQAGMLCLYERAQLYGDILNCHMNNEQHDDVIALCKRFGQSNSELWVQALAYFGDRETTCRSHIKELLQYIEENEILSPLVVVQTLAKNPNATFGLVKDYIIKKLKQEDDQIKKDELEIKSKQDETERIRQKIQALKTTATVFQVSRCNICTHPLELPTVHFLCQHSFHKQCFDSYADPDTPEECPACVTDNRKFINRLKSQDPSKDLYEQFQQDMAEASDSFSVIADYFGKGLFSPDEK